MFEDLAEHEQNLVLCFIKFTKAEDVESMSADELLAQAPLTNIPAAVRKKYFKRSLDALANTRVFSTVATSKGIRIEIHEDFIDDALTLYRDTPLFPGESADPLIDIPASDRFVSIGDNQPILEETKEALALLSNAIRGSNELFATAEDRLQVSKEIDHIRELISVPRIHVIAVWDATKNNRALKWLIEQGISGIVRETAIKAFEHLDKLVHFLASL